jgi:phenylpyruvate tautomerase PptA (4-oxalocrotonate tautomerase family)
VSFRHHTTRWDLGTRERGLDFDRVSVNSLWRVQVLTPVGILDREKQLGVVKELTEIVAAAAGDPSYTERTWVLITEPPEGGWGIAGHANTNTDIVAAARAALASD